MTFRTIKKSGQLVPYGKNLNLINNKTGFLNRVTIFDANRHPLFAGEDWNSIHLIFRTLRKREQSTVTT